jgi:hypothetical protein
MPVSARAAYLETSTIETGVRADSCHGNVARIAAEIRINVTDISSTYPIHAPLQRVPRQSTLQLG